MSDLFVRDLTQLSCGVNRIAPDPVNPRRVALGRTNQSLALVEDGAEVWSRSFFTDDDKVRPTQRFRGLDFSASGRTLYAAVGNELHFIDAQTGTSLVCVKQKPALAFLIVSPVCLSAFGDRVAVAFDNGSIGVWREDGTKIEQWKDNNSPRQIRMVSETLIVGTDGYHLSTWSGVDSTFAKRTAQHVKTDENVYAFDAALATGFAMVRSLYSLRLLRLTDGSVVWNRPSEVGFPLVAMHSTLPIFATSGEGSVVVRGLEGEDRAVIEVPSPAICLRWQPGAATLLIGCEAGEFRSDKLSI